MSGRIDWPGLMRAGLHGLGLEPAAFWRLTPVELRIMLGAEQAALPLTRARLAELAAAFPDRTRGDRDGRDLGSDGPVGGAGGKAWQLDRDGGGL
ncbi:rcc01693 family protein [Xinfangfangia pollutisoli]|uniref:rcc01693 family protein n=1 Tax=Xinfangfangia pollutisoli TaxID=2865960 RepID=UPI00385012CF